MNLTQTCLEINEWVYVQVHCWRSCQKTRQILKHKGLTGSAVKTGGSFFFGKIKKKIAKEKEKWLIA